MDTQYKIIPIAFEYAINEKLKDITIANYSSPKELLIATLSLHIKNNNL